MRRHAWVLVCALATVPGCSRDKDPYADWKAPQFLDEGERLLRANDLSGANNFLRRGIAKAEKAGARPEQTRIFVSRMLYIYAAQGNIAEVEKIFAQTGGAAAPRSMDARMGLQLAILLKRAGREADARALAEKLALRLDAKPADPEEIAFYAAGWIVIDLLRSANVELTRAKEASDAFVATLTTIAGTLVAPHQPMLPGLRPWIMRYVDHLYDSERTLVAQQVADIVERIDESAGTTEDKSACLLLDRNFPTLGCLAAWPTK